MKLGGDGSYFSRRLVKFVPNGRLENVQWLKQIPYSRPINSCGWNATSSEGMGSAQLVLMWVVRCNPWKLNWDQVPDQSCDCGAEIQTMTHIGNNCGLCVRYQGV